MCVDRRRLTTGFQAAKERKRLEKEQAKKSRAERDRLRNVLVLQHVLSLLEDQSFRSLLLTGVDGVPPITEERLKKIDKFKETVALDGKISEENFSKQADAVVDRLMFLAEGKKKDAVKGLTYADLKELLLSIHKCGFIAAAATGGQKTGTKAKADPAPPAAAIAQPQPQPQPQQQLADGPAVYSFGTVAGVDTRPDQDPAVVSIIPGFAAANGSIPSQIYTNPSYSGMFVPVTGAVVPGGHILPAGQLIAAGPQHFQSQPPADPSGQQFDQQPVDQTTFEVSNLNLNDGQTQSAENEFRHKDSRRNKFQSQGYRRDERPNKNADFHGASNGFQRKPDRYQGNNRGTVTVIHCSILILILMLTLFCLQMRGQGTRVTADRRVDVALDPGTTARPLHRDQQRL